MWEEKAQEREQVSDSSKDHRGSGQDGNQGGPWMR